MRPMLEAVLSKAARGVDEGEADATAVAATASPLHASSVPDP